MKYVHEYRAPEYVRNLALKLQEVATRPWTLMEVCGGQTHSIMKFGLHDLLPENIRLIHGPGCPVCVTPLHLIDHAVQIAKEPQTILCSFGDMLRVPGSKESLLYAKAHGADVRTVLSPLDAVRLAQLHPEKQVVFFGVGFETTAPANAMAVHMAHTQGVKNFSLLASHVLVVPALQFLLQAQDCDIQGFLAAGHVCTVTGYRQYHQLAHTYHVPISITGFEPVDILQGILACVRQLENGTCAVENHYLRSVREEGNCLAQKMVEQVFEVIDRQWRGIGLLPRSGLGMRCEYSSLDAAVRFPMKMCDTFHDCGCISGLVLQGKKTPCQCPHFGTRCTPQFPLGAPMVSTEGACAAYYQYSGAV